MRAVAFIYTCTYKTYIGEIHHYISLSLFYEAPRFGFFSERSGGAPFPYTTKKKPNFVFE